MPGGLSWETICQDDVEVDTDVDVETHSGRLPESLPGSLCGRLSGRFPWDSFLSSLGLHQITT